jgi:pyrroline-5-carboxylate reductase
MSIYIVGTGVMGSAIAKILASKKYKVFVYDKNADKANALKKYGVVLDSGLKKITAADFILLSVKPYHLTDLQLKPSAKQILVSIAAGVKISKLQKIFGTKKVVRVMPNLGLAVGQGIAAYKTAGLNNVEKNKIGKLLNDISESFEVADENKIDAVTAISGSGPAYFFVFANALQKSAKALGFNDVTARKLVEKTFSAAAALQKNDSYDELMKQVASKKGTTEQALNVFKKLKLDGIVSKAAQAARKRAQEISNE